MSKYGFWPFFNIRSSEFDVDIEYKGIILQYLKNNEPYYIYAPFMLNDINSVEYKEWFDIE